jgi:hypothetical protein
MPSLRSAVSRVLVAWSIRKGLIGTLDGGLRGDPEPGAIAVHVNKRCRVAKVDDNGGASANVSDQLPREPPVVPYLVHICH